MADEYMDGFDRYSTAQIPREYPDSSGSVSIVTGLFGSGGALHVGYNQRVNQPLTARSTYVVGFDYLGSSTYHGFFILTKGSKATIVAIHRNADGSISTDFGNSDPGILWPGTIYNIQVKLVISATAGIFVVKVDGVTVINQTGSNWVNTGTDNINGISFYNDNISDATFDNAWVFNTLGTHSNDFPVGRLSIQPHMPSADGAHTDLTPNTGSRYSCVSDVPADDDTTFIASGTPGAMGTFGVPALTGSINRIHAVKINAVMRKTDVDSKTAHIVLQSGSTLAESADIAVSLNYGDFSMILPDDPATSAQWTISGANATQPGVKVVA